MTESAYVLRRAELHQRPLVEGQSPWSIRQTAVYHTMSRPCSTSAPNPQWNEPQSRFLFISPSETAERKMGRLFDLASSQNAATHHSFIHSMLVADSIKGWMGYIAWLERDLKEKVYADQGNPWSSVS